MTFPQGEKTIIIDDFAGNMACQDFLKVCDKYPLKVQVKGGYVPACWEKIVITTNIHPNKWWKDHYEKVPDHKKAVKRRIHLLLHFKKNYHELVAEQEGAAAGAGGHKDRDELIDMGGIDDITDQDWDEHEAQAAFAAETV